jgi:UDP-N-acetyl-D-mannosaminuronic acid dehydrogenase
MCIPPEITLELDGVKVNFNKICVLGLGYIGLPTACTFATHGIAVVGVDVNEDVLATLRRGELHIQEPGLRIAVETAIHSGHLTFSEKPVEADAFIIAVPTPFHEDKYGKVNSLEYKLADMRAVTSATEAILPFLRKGNLVVLESTSPPRTTVDLVAPILEKSGLKTGKDFHLVYSPERVLPGQILRELIDNARVIGGVTPEAAQAGRDLYSVFVKGQILTTDATTAEMVKLMENTYRDINIAIANEFSRLAERFGVDVWEAISLASLHPRVKILRPGPGVGGHCISVDPWFFVEAAPDLAALIHTARRVNDSQPQFALDLVRKAVGSLKGKRVAALGLAFKEDVDDLRESPAVELARLMEQEGALVKAFEPNKPDARFEGFETVPNLAEALLDADLMVLLVGHREFKQFTPHEIAAQTPARLVVDMRGILPRSTWEAAGFRLFSLGDGRPSKG